MTIQLPEYPKSDGPVAAQRLARHREKAAEARAALAAELVKLDAQAAETLQLWDQRDNTRDRLTALGREQSEQERRDRR